MLSTRARPGAGGLEEALTFVDEVFGVLRSDLGGLPAMATRDLSIRRDIETAVNSILNKTATRLEAHAKTLKPDGAMPS